MMNSAAIQRFALERFKLRQHFNKLRWICLCTVFSILIVLPMLSVYQSYVAAHAYDLLSPAQKTLYDLSEFSTSWIVDDPEHDLDLIKGTTWSANIFGLKISDPLAVAGQVSASLSVHKTFLLTALIPVILTALLGRFFCGWICPATLLYELNSNLGAWLLRIGIPVGTRRFDRRLKYGVLVVGLILSSISGSVLVAGVYPPAVIGREMYYAIALGGFGGGAVFFCLTLLFDLLVGRRAFCRYLCPGGALYSLLGRYRILRIQRQVESCNDCAKCSAVCEFQLDPMGDDFGQECNNCTACIAVCPTDALRFEIALSDVDGQGPGHLGHGHRLNARSKHATISISSVCILILSLGWSSFPCVTYAHHVLGRPAYSLNEDSTTPPSMQVETQIGGYFVTYMVFPAFPSANEPGRVNLYASRISDGQPYLGEVSFKVRDGGWLSRGEEVLGIQAVDDNVYRQGFEFKTDGDYIIRAEFEAQGEPYQIDFPLRIGPRSMVGPLGITVGIIVFVLVGVSLLQRSRITTTKIRTARQDRTACR